MDICNVRDLNSIREYCQGNKFSAFLTVFDLSEAQTEALHLVGQWAFLGVGQGILAFAQGKYVGQNYPGSCLS